MALPTDPTPVSYSADPPFPMIRAEISESGAFLLPRLTTLQAEAWQAPGSDILAITTLRCCCISRGNVKMRKSAVPVAVR